MRLAEILDVVKKVVWSQGRTPVLEEGEKTILGGRVILMASGVGTRIGPLLLTNRRLIWYETVVARPCKPIYGEVRLSEVASVDKGTIFDLIGGNKRLRLRLRSGRDKCFAEADGRLNEWIAALRQAIGSNPA